MIEELDTFAKNMLKDIARPLEGRVRPDDNLSHLNL